MGLAWGVRAGSWWNAVEREKEEDSQLGTLLRSMRAAMGMPKFYTVPPEICITINPAKTISQNHTRFRAFHVLHPIPLARRRDWKVGGSPDIGGWTGPVLVRAEVAQAWGSPGSSH